MTKAKRAYDRLAALSRETADLASAMALLDWDQQTMLPPAGQAGRARQLAALAGVVHKRATDKRVGELLARIEDSELVAEPLSPEAVNVREWRRDYEKAVRIPAELATAMALAASEGRAAWEKARAANDWAAFAPHLEKLLALTKRKAQCLGFANEPYDALLDEFEPGETARELEPLFASLRAGLVPLIEALVEAEAAEPSPTLTGDYPILAQEAFLRRVIAAMGFDRETGRLDTAAHPFSSHIGPGDVRITTRFDPTDPRKALFGVVHETGHALYSLGCPAHYFGSPMGHSVSLGVHESQSRLWENLVARSRSFWQWCLPLAKAHFPALKDFTPETMYRAVNVARPDYVRVEADETTYNLHVMLRFELELALFRDELDVAGLPEAWNAKMREFLGITPPNVALGALQDVHWSMGAFGYFPTYSLGNLYAAQFFETARTALGELDGQFARGEFAPLLSWLRENIHLRARSLAPRRLVRAVTGRDRDAAPFLDYLRRKYGELRGLRL